MLSNAIIAYGLASQTWRNDFVVPSYDVVLISADEGVIFEDEFVE